MILVFIRHIIYFFRLLITHMSISFLQMIIYLMLAAVIIYHRMLSIQLQYTVVTMNYNYQLNKIQIDLLMVYGSIVINQI